MKGEEIDNIIIKTIQRGIDQGDLPNRPAQDLFLCMQSAMIGAFEMIWGSHSPHPTPKQVQHLTKLFTDFVLAGLLALED